MDFVDIMRTMLNRCTPHIGPDLTTERYSVRNLFTVLYRDLTTFSFDRSLTSVTKWACNPDGMLWNEHPGMHIMSFLHFQWFPWSELNAAPVDQRRQLLIDRERLG